MKIVRNAAILVAIALPLSALAQQPHRPLDIAATLGIDAARAAQVQSILQAAREKRRAAMQQIQADTDTRLATVLSADELARLKAALPHPPGPRRAASANGASSQ